MQKYLVNRDNGHSSLLENQSPIVTPSHFGFVKFQSSTAKKRLAVKEIIKLTHFCTVSLLFLIYLM